MLRVVNSGFSQRKWGCLDFNIDWEAVRNIAGKIFPLKFLRLLVIDLVLFSSSHHDAVHVPHERHLPLPTVCCCKFCALVVTRMTVPIVRFPGIGWSYFGADPEWGECQAAQLQVRRPRAFITYIIHVIARYYFLRRRLS